MVYDVLQELIEQKQALSSTTTYDNLIQWGGQGGHKVRDVCSVESGDIKAVFLQPIIDEVTDIGKDHYTINSTEDAGVLEDWENEYLHFKVIHQARSKSPVVMRCPIGTVLLTDVDGNEYCVGGNPQCTNPGYEVVCLEAPGSPNAGDTIVCRDPVQHGETGPVSCAAGSAQCIETAAGYWAPYCVHEEEDDPTEGDEWISSVVRSKFDLIANPFLLVKLWRKALDEDFKNEVKGGTRVPPFSAIAFGLSSKSGWCLVIPYGQEPFLCEWDPDDENAWFGWVRREWTHGQLGRKDARETSKPPFMFWIGVIDGKICVSENGFADDFAYYQPHKLKAETIKSSYIEIGHWPGEFTFAIRPLIMNEGHLTRKRTRVPNSHWDDDDMVRSVWGVRRPGVALLDDVAVSHELIPEPASGTGQYRWMIRITPGTYTYDMTAPLADVTSYSCPTVTAIRVRYRATITDNGVGAYVDYAEDIAEVLADARAEERAAKSSVMTVRNHHGEATDFHEGRLVELRDVGFEFDDDSEELANLDALWTLEPEWSGSWCRVPLTDLLGLLAVHEIDFGGCMLAGISGYNALVFLAERAGFGTGWYDFEDLGALWDSYPPLYEPFKFDIGTSYADAMREVAQVCGNAALWCEDNVLKTGCPYCRTKRVLAGNEWQTHQDNGWNSTGCLAADIVRAGPTGIDKVCFANPEDATDPTQHNELVGIEATRRNIGRWEYANVVTVHGMDEKGMAVAKTYTDWDALYGVIAEPYFGFLISKTEQMQGIATADNVSAEALQLYEKLSPKPLYVAATALADAGVRLGHVIKIEGGETKGVHDKVFRVVAVEHTLRKDQAATTRITARYMRDAA